MRIEIRRLGPDDAALLDRVAADVFDGLIRPERLAAYLAEPGHIMVVARAGDLVVGQAAAVLHRHPDMATELYVDNVGVSPDYQRQGIARRMLEELFAIGRERGCEESWVGTEADNLPASRLYEGFGAPGEACVFFTYRL